MLFEDWGRTFQFLLLAGIAGESSGLQCLPQSSQSYNATFVMYCYVLMSTIMLLNMLIAMRVERVQTQGHSTRVKIQGWRAVVSSRLRPPVLRGVIGGAGPSQDGQDFRYHLRGSGAGFSIPSVIDHGSNAACIASKR